LSDIELSKHLERKRLNNKRFNNRVVKSIGRAGHRLSLFGLIRHVGRKSGKQYVTPVRLVHEGDDFIIPLTYGVNCDWYRNLTVTNKMEIVWQGKTYQVGNPELLELSQGLQKFPWISRRMFKREGLKNFVQVNKTE
jgi:deazaflavin-dependent oxidoreductase (nitroreductase family)